MNDPTIGWIAAIIIGGIAGWLAEQFMTLHEYCARHRGSGHCQRHLQFLGDQSRRVARLLDCRIRRRMFADLDRSSGAARLTRTYCSKFC